MMIQAAKLPCRQELVIAIGQASSENVVSSLDQPMQHLFSTQEKADTRMVLHSLDASQSGYQQIIVQNRDTHVLVLLIYFMSPISSSQIWMNSGTAKKPRFIPVHKVHASLPQQVVLALPAFHCITGCDTTNQFSGHGKKSGWKVFVQHPEMLQPMDGTGTLDLLLAETFVAKLY